MALEQIQVTIARQHHHHHPPRCSSDLRVFLQPSSPCHHLNVCVDTKDGVDMRKQAAKGRRAEALLASLFQCRILRDL